MFTPGSPARTAPGPDAAASGSSTAGRLLIAFARAAASAAASRVGLSCQVDRRSGGDSHHPVRRP
jgi:hypothetical protein